MAKRNGAVKMVPRTGTKADCARTVSIPIDFLELKILYQSLIKSLPLHADVLLIVPSMEIPLPGN